MAGVVAVSLISQTIALDGRPQETKTEGDPAFEVVSVKATGPNHLLPPDASGVRPMSTRPFRYVGQSLTGNQTLSAIIQKAYSVEDWEIAGGPSWIDSLTYEISARTPPNTSRETARLMLRTMLVERFGLKFHREKRDLVVYELIAGKDGFKLRKTTDPPPYSNRMKNGFLTETNTLDMLAIHFSHFADRPVVNMTGIQGMYRVELNWPPLGESGNFTKGYDGLFWKALERVAGLKIEKRTVQRDVIVIDHVEREPTPN